MKARIDIIVFLALFVAVVLAPGRIERAGAQPPASPAGKSAPTKEAPKGDKKVKQTAVITMEKGGVIALEFFPEDAPRRWRTS